MRRADKLQIISNVDQLPTDDQFNDAVGEVDEQYAKNAAKRWRDKPPERGYRTILEADPE